jgi:hypothetical protein
MKWDEALVDIASVPGITAGIEVSRTQGDAAAGCHGSGAPS